MKFKKGDRVIINPRKRDCPWYSTKIYTIINHRIGREGEKVSKLNENLRGAEQFGYSNEIKDDYLILYTNIERKLKIEKLNNNEQF